MKNKTTLLIFVGLLGVAVSSFAEDETTEDQHGHARNGKFLFDKETFGGNGRSCVTCHSKKTGTVSIDEIQERFAKDPEDTLFRSPDSDNLDGLSFTRLLTTGTIKIDVPLAPNVKLAANSSATTATIFRGTPTVKNVTTLQPFLMSDGRESSSDLPHQALSAVHQHTQNTVEPTAEQLDRIAEFERTDERFFSSEALRKFAAGGPPPKLPRGKTPSERRGREFFIHDNSARTLEAVLNHYNRLFQFINDQVPDLLPLMTERDQIDIIAFLKLL